MIDSVIGSASGLPISREFLEDMKKSWFGPSSPGMVPAVLSEDQLKNELLTRLRACLEANNQVAERLNRLIDGVESGTAGVPVWSLDKLETGAREMAKQFAAMAAILRVM